MCQIIVSFPRKVQSCIVLKGIYESQWWVGRRKGLCGRETSHCDLRRKQQGWGAEVEKPTRKLHKRVFPLHLEGRVRVGLNHKVQELDGVWQLCEVLSASICHQDLANHVFWGILEDGNVRRKLRLRVKCFISSQWKKNGCVGSWQYKLYRGLIPLLAKTRTERLVFLLFRLSRC